MTFIESLDPPALWSHFDKILTIPRGSKQEEKIRRFVLDLAEAHGLEYQVDGTGNVVVRKPASSDKESCPITILQSHLDMVNEKNSDVDHDFAVDAINPQQEGEYVKASGTTLGSDNGIGVAAMLAIMEDTELVHGPLELLFTVDEETGLTGAKNLDSEMLQGRQLINLDSEEEGTLCVGCAGGGDSALTLPLTMSDAPEGAAMLRTRLHGLQGGHSGIDIHLQRGNATQLLARALYSVSLSTEFLIAEIDGGNMHNAIPREAVVDVVIDEQHKSDFMIALQGEVDAIVEEFKSVDPGMALEISERDVSSHVMDPATTSKLLQLVTGLPHGIITMSNDIPGLVETSTNLATVKQQEGYLAVGLSSRSSVASALTALRQRIRAIAGLAGATVEEQPGYPGWKPDLDSKLLAIVKGLHENVLGSEPKIEAVHAGLECGLIGEMIPSMDMISFGPQIEFPHSPNERVKIASVGRFYDLLTSVLEELANDC